MYTMCTASLCIARSLFLFRAMSMWDWQQLSYERRHPRFSPTGRGTSHFGKSSLAASFLEAGYQVLTDDLLMIEATDNGVFAYPGPPRIKLYPETARRFREGTLSGVPMNPETEKMIVPLNSSQSCSTKIP